MYELIILSLLMSGPVHGYLIVKVMNDIVGPYTKLSHGRLYPLLARLEEDGMIVASSEPVKERAGGRNLRRFQITEKGRRRFHEVMMDTTVGCGYFASLLGGTALIAHLEVIV